MKQKSLYSNRQDMPVSEKKDRKEERRKKASEGKVGGGVQVLLENSNVICLFFFQIHNLINRYRAEKQRRDPPKRSTCVVRMIPMMTPKMTRSERALSVLILRQWRFCARFLRQGIPIKKVVELLKKQEAISDAPDEFVVELASRLHK